MQSNFSCMRNLFVKSRKFAWISFAEARTFSRFFQRALGYPHFSTLSTNNKRNQRKSWRVNFHDHHRCPSRSYNETKLQAIWNNSNNSHRLGAGGRHGRRHDNVKGRWACEIIYGSPERHKKILFERLFSRSKKINAYNRGQRKSVLNCTWNQILSETNRRK